MPLLNPIVMFYLFLIFTMFGLGWTCCLMFTNTKKKQLTPTEQAFIEQLEQEIDLMRDRLIVLENVEAERSNIAEYYGHAITAIMLVSQGKASGNREGAMELISEIAAGIHDHVIEDMNGTRH